MGRFAIIKELGAVADGTRVLLVDGNAVRHRIDPAFTQGGHGYVYKYIPKDEIWVEQVLDEDDLVHNTNHEVEEYHLMKYQGLTYAKAHDIAMAHESVERAKCKSF